ncbi:MAG: protein-L-isoaspartate O-methyltransferase [Hyphomicrobiaceae bacterium]
MIDCALQRTNMVESQIRPSDVTDRRIMRAMADLPRERFVPPSLAALAYMDESISLYDASHRGPARRMLSPRTLAKLIQLANVEPTDRVLDAGTGRGYGAAVLARLASSVVAIENDSTLAIAAIAALETEKNVTVVSGALDTAAPAQGEFDVIVLEGAVFDRPDSLLSLLKPGGRLVAVLNDAGVGRATVWLRQGSTFGQFTAFEAAITPLPGFERAAAFTF